MHYLHYDPETLVIKGTGYTPDGTYPPHTMPCTDKQAQSWRQWQLLTVEGIMVLALLDDAEELNG